MAINYERKEQAHVDAVYKAMKKSDGGGIKRPKLPDGWYEEYLRNQSKRLMKEKGGIVNGKA